MKITCLETLESAWLAAEGWRELARRNPLLSPDWLLSWWRYFGEGGSLMVLECTSPSGEVVGIAPFFRRSRFGSVSVESLGTGSVCTDYMQVLSKDGYEQPVAAAVTEYLSNYFEKHCFTRAGGVTVEAVEDSSYFKSVFLESACKLGYQCWEQPLTSTYRIALPESISDYVQNLGASAKRKAKKLFSRIGVQPLSYRQTVGKHDIRLRLEVLQKLHQARRSVLAQSGCFADVRFRNFLFEAVELLADRGQARIDWYEVGESTIATHLVIQGTNSLLLYQSGVDPAYMVHEPGHLLTLSTIQNAIQTGYQFYDLMRGDERYKAYWGAQAVPISTLYCRPPHWISQLAGQSHFHLWRVKQAAKRALAACKSLCHSSPSASRFKAT